MDGSSQAPLSMEFFRQEYWSGLPCPLPGDFPDPEIEPESPTLAGSSLPLSHQGSIWRGFGGYIVKIPKAQCLKRGSRRAEKIFYI